MAADNLNRRQQKFCVEYIKTGNGAKAAINAGYSERTAKNQASRLLTNVNVKEYVEKLKKEAIERNKIELDEVVSILSSLVRFDIADIYHPDGTIKELHEMSKEARLAIETIETTQTIKKKRKGRKTKICKVKVSDRKRSIDMLLRYFGAYREDNEQKAATIEQVVQFRFPDNGRSNSSD